MRAYHETPTFELVCLSSRPQRVIKKSRGGEYKKKHGERERGGSRTHKKTRARKVVRRTHTAPLFNTLMCATLAPHRGVYRFDENKEKERDNCVNLYSGSRKSFCCGGMIMWVSIVPLQNKTCCLFSLVTWSITRIEAIELRRMLRNAFDT